MVLFVDDDRDDLRIASRYLSEFQCVVTTCQDAKVGLEKLHVDWFDLCFVDLWLQGMTGCHFVEHAKPRNQNIEFYILSADWNGSVGSKMLTKAMRLNAHPIVKGGRPRSGDLHTFRQTLEFILVKKEPYV